MAEAIEQKANNLEQDGYDVVSFTASAKAIILATGAQPVVIPGMEPDLPSIQAELEARGQLRIDLSTGEILE